jgi:hypothetical protein
MSMFLRLDVSATRGLLGEDVISDDELINEAMREYAEAGGLDVAPDGIGWDGALDEDLADELPEELWGDAA